MGLKKLSAQRVHVERPAVAPKVPGEHGMHAPADAAPKSGWYEPAPHGTHEEALVLPLVLPPCVPGRHGMHADTPLAPVVGL